VSCLGTTDIPERFDEKGNKYKATADDSAYATFRLKGGVIAHINMSWVTRVYRDDLVTFQVDGTHGSAGGGAHRLRHSSPPGDAAAGVESRRETHARFL
jgi:predicted dehydrogenase